jgi:5-methylcytosine-specific restriction endonuclease McrA
MPPVWFDEQIAAFEEAVRLAADGHAEAARVQLGLVRGEDLQRWYIEHGQMSGIFRDRHFGRPKPIVTVRLDPVASPQRFAREVLRRDGYRCRYCGVRLIPKEVLKAFSRVVGQDSFCTSGTNLQRHGVVLAFRANVDHVVPWKLGGRTELQNLVSACWSCNYGKGVFTLDQIGVDDPRLRSMPASDDWDGLMPYVPGLRAHPASDSQQPA